MRPIGRVAQAPGAAPPPRPVSGPADQAVGRALVPCPVTPVARPRGRLGAAFLAHLIATAGRLPQTCERRRAEPAEAIAAYGANMREPPAGRVMRVA